MKRIFDVSEHVRKRFLPQVRKPGRYIGGEINQISKDPARSELSVALCFPDVYEVGMSHTGMAILYHVLNSMEGVSAQRCFAPWIDAEEILRREDIPLFSLESKWALGSFDILGFSITSELCYTNVLQMLDLAGIPLRSKERTDDDPLIIAGGGMANCCEPMADFVDLFVLGEAEEAVVELAKLVMESKKAGRSKADTLRTAVERYDWAYVPALYGQPGMRSHFHSAVVSDFDNAPVPTKPIIPFVQAVHERVSVEIMRGCPGRCRFCQASFCRRPIRYRSIDRIVEIAKAQYQSTGFDTVSLLSLSTGDYPKLDELVAKLNEYFSPLHVGISLPSLRVDEQLALLPTLGASVRKSGLTIAVEAASMRLRQAINKPLTDENLIAGVEAAYRAGYRSVKLYFMTGFPGETQDDIRAIFDLCVHLATIRKAIDGRMGAVTAAVSWLVPKAHTPFGFLAQKPRDYFENARRIILDEKRRARIKYVDFKFHDINRSILESAIGRGGRELGSVIETAYRSGARFDLWDECFDNQRWLDAFASHNLDLESLAQRQFTPDETPPWQHLGGPRPEVLWDHFNAALETL